MMRSSTPLKKDILAFAVLIMQTLFDGVVGKVGVTKSLFSAQSETGTIVNVCFGIRKSTSFN
jgi:hypothetical protein